MASMKTLIAALVATAAVATPMAASAAPWQSINQRQANLERRIDQGIRSGALNRNEAQRLRGQFREISRLEANYRRSNGLSLRERTDLDRRFDALSRRINVQKDDRQQRR
jgi:Ni/Co efflux regulator RcnB